MLRQLLKLTFVFALLLTGLNLSAQKNVVFELDGGYSMIGDNSQTGFGLNADLGYTFWGRLTPTVGYQFHTFANQRNHYDTNANIDLAYFAVKVTALKFKWFSLDLGPLAFRRMWKQEYKVHDGYTVYKDGLTMDGNNIYSYYKPQWGYGGVAGVKFDLFKKSGVKLDVTYQIDTDRKDSMMFYSGGVFFRF
ncbi:MAG: hypothetical protein IPI42_03380 [Saprospiraceae bacterium]|nr:MAG: hypothetical protein UZ08_BCD001002710 [Candidatus Parvibacillus calidus]MBK7739617.1 hypothetical protein [Candidatus Parvibacillus calidus]